MTRLRFFLLCATLALAGCSDDGGMADDTGVGDTGMSDTGTGDTGTGDTGMSDTGTGDTGTGDTGTGDTGTGMDGATDGGVDGGADASADGGSDAAVDAAADATADARADAAADATPDASSDCGGVVCAATEYCEYTTPFACGGAGACIIRPTICTAIFDPHCGCNGMTYSNECAANAAGQDVASAGSCP